MISEWFAERGRERISKALQGNDSSFEFSLEGNAEGYGGEDGCFNKYTQAQQAVSVTCTRLSSSLKNLPFHSAKWPWGSEDSQTLQGAVVGAVVPVAWSQAFRSRPCSGCLLAMLEIVSPSLPLLDSPFLLEEEERSIRSPG